MLRKHRILIILIVIAIALIGSAIAIRPYTDHELSEEISKVLMTLGATVIVGGLLRFLLEDFKNEMAKEEKQKELTKELVDMLRQVYDAVELSRILIESHKTAKTYGERIRIRIIPAKISLYHVKRGIYDREDFISLERGQKIRLSVHFMIAYLHSLIEEYQTEYFKLSNLQAYQEEIKKQSRSEFTSLIFEENNASEQSYDDLEQVNLAFEQKKEVVPSRPLTVWNEIDSLEYLSDFLDADRASKYFKFFASQYHYCKKLIRSKPKDEIIPPYPKLEEKYLTKIVDSDNQRSNGDYIPAFDLVMDIFEQEFERKAKTSNQ